jgi:glutamyl-Q tRNA(Asp) synthetase
VLYQSRRHDAYGAALERLRRAGALYACGCTRREIADSSLNGIEGPIYSGSCRRGLAPGRAARAWRVRVDGVAIEFHDALQGTVRSVLADDIGDFVVRRADGLFAYQLAVVVDDAAQGITEVVRGADLLDSTPRQIHLQCLLGLPTPAYLHLPVVLNAAGEKLGKQTGAAALDPGKPLPTLWRALAFLGQQPPPGLLEGDLGGLWRWAALHWSPARIPRVKGVSFSD